MTTDLEREQQMAVRFAKDVENHTLTVLHDHDGYLHLRFRQPDTGMYWFDIVCWPGTLAVRGDMGNFVFARIEDMLSFFRGQRINPQYWAEKEVTGAPTQAFDPNAAADAVRLQATERLMWDDLSPEDTASVTAELERMLRSEDWFHRDGARELLAHFVVQLDTEEWRFHDVWEWDLETWTPQYLWCCFAIVHAIEQYDQQTAPKDQETA